MFDRITKVDASWPSTVKIQHHRATAADDVRVYGELLDKARDEVLWSVEVADNVIGEVVSYRSLREQMTVVRFTLNGRRYVIDVDDKAGMLERNAHARCAAVQRALASAIAEQLAMPTMMADVPGAGREGEER